MRCARSWSIALPAKEREDQAQNDADDNAGDDWEIESRIATFDSDITRKFTQKSRADAGPKNDSDDNNCDTDNDEKFSEFGHDSIFCSDSVVSSLTGSGGFASRWGRLRPLSELSKHK